MSGCSFARSRRAANAGLATVQALKWEPPPRKPTISASDLLQRLLSTGLSTLGGNARSPQANDGFGRGKNSGGVTGGALGMLMGSRGGRKLGGTAVKTGGAAALGLLAYKAYTHWQSQQAAQAGKSATATQGTGAVAAPAPAASQSAPLLQRLPAPAPRTTAAPCCAP